MVEKLNEVPRDPRFLVNIWVDCFISTDGGARLKKKPSEDIVFKTLVRNISSKGAFLVAKYPLKVSEVFKVSFPIQSSATPFISTPRTLVEVRWIKPYHKEDLMLGLRFLL
jgi:hypothetical protein